MDNQTVYFNKQTGEASVYLPADYLYSDTDHPDLFEEAVLDIVKRYLANIEKKKMSANDFKQAWLLESFFFFFFFFFA